MMRIQKRHSRFRKSIAISLLAMVVLFSSSARTQGSHAIGVANGDNNASKNEMKFEVVSIKRSKPGTGWSQGPGVLPNGYQNRGLNLWQIIMLAYNPQPPMLVWGSAKLLNAPGWVVQDMYDIDARVGSEDLTAWQKQNQFDPVLLRSALQQALKERCHLSLHATTSEVPYLDLVVSKHGLKIKEMAAGQSVPARAWTLPDGGRMALEMRAGKSYVDKHFYGVTMREFAVMLTQISYDRPVQDMTGLRGRYEFTWEKRDDPEGDPRGEVYNWPIDSLGLALKPGKGPAITFVVDHIERPTAN